MRVMINDDFDPEKIDGSGQCFRWESTGSGGYRIPFRGLCLRIEPAGDECFDLDCTEEEFENIWRGYFDLEENYADIRSRIDPEEDPYLFEMAERGKGIRILRQDPWETLVSFIISQNRNIPAIRRSVELLCRAAGTRKTDRAGEEYYAFPAPEAVVALGEDVLRDCRLGYRCSYVRAAAECALGGVFDPIALEKASDEELLEELTRIRGVGIKVAGCVALFGFHRMDSFPVDTRIRRVLREEYPEGFPMERYSPYGGVYQQYLFAGKTFPLSRS